MNVQVINCPNCGEKLVYTKNDALFGDNKFRCDKCNKTYIENLICYFYCKNHYFIEGVRSFFNVYCQ